MIDLKKPVETRDGRKARIIATDASGIYPVIALVQQRHGSEEPRSYTRQGGYFVGSTSCHDLTNAKKREELFVNLGHTHASEEAARNSAPDNWPVARILVEDGKVVSMKEATPADRLNTQLRGYGREL